MTGGRHYGTRAETAAWHTEALEMRSRGHSVGEISRRLGKRTTTICNVIKLKSSPDKDAELTRTPN